MPEKQMSYVVVVTQGSKVETFETRHNNEEDALIEACNYILKHFVVDFVYKRYTLKNAEDLIEGIENQQYEGVLELYNNVMERYGRLIEIGYFRVYNEDSIVINEKELAVAKGYIEGAHRNES